MTNRANTGQPAPSKSSVRLTVLPDPPQIPDMAIQLPDIARALYTLQDHFLSRGDTVVMGNGYLCLDAGNVRGAPYPDLLVAFGMPAPPADIVASNGYTISEIGKPPDFVLEVASASTGRRDYTEKREIYSGYGVAEYWRFDRTGGRFHDAPLGGDSLQPDGSYEPIPVDTADDGSTRGYSAVLGVELRWVAGVLRFWDPVTADYMPDLTEAKAERDAALDQRDSAFDQRDVALNQRDEALDRVRELEAELRRERN